MRLPTLALIGAICLRIGSAEAQTIKTALDCYHNNERSPHYTWRVSGVGGYAEFAKVVRANGGDTASLRAPFTAQSLAPYGALIVSDPDTPAESASPKYVTAEEADAVDQWVQAGGLLFLMANDMGNCEFTNFNVLAGKFGMRFNEDRIAGPTFSSLPPHPFFTGCRAVFMRDVSSLTLTGTAEAVLTTGGKTIMATARKGKGTVIALGDPWVYDEHINDDDNEVAIVNVMKWLYAQKGAVALRPSPGASRAPIQGPWVRADGRRDREARGLLFRHPQP